MSVYGEGIIDRLPDASGLKNTDNVIAKLIDNGVGEWLTNYDEEHTADRFFLTEATEKYLDLHGADLGITRKINESDDDYRERIILESLGHLTVRYLIEVYSLELYAFVDEFNVEDNTLTSDNYYISHNGFMTVADETIKKILKNKFVIGRGLTWLNL